VIRSTRQLAANRDWICANAVDFPLPEGPTRATTRPGPIGSRAGSTIHEGAPGSGSPNCTPIAAVLNDGLPYDSGRLQPMSMLATPPPFPLPRPATPLSTQLVLPPGQSPATLARPLFRVIHATRNT
jgi:hypothetical protein